MSGGGGVEVLDKAVAVPTVLEASSLALAGLVGATGPARPTVYRLTVALKHHRLVARDPQGRFVLGPRPAELAGSAAKDPLPATVGPTLTRPRNITGKPAQLFCHQGDFRIRSTTVERPSDLRDTVPLGVQLSTTAGSAAQVLLAWEEPENLPHLLKEATFAMLSPQQVRRCGWTQSVTKREPGVASVSAPVLSLSGKIIMAVNVSGPIGRLARQPGRLHAPAVMVAAERLSEMLRCNDTE